MRPYPLLLTTLLLALAACSDPLPVAAFKDTAPPLDPVRFFVGHAKSWGVLENRSGQPASIVLTDCTGTADGPDGLRMTQKLTIGTEAPVTREWRMHRLPPGADGVRHFEASANDMVGTTIGEASGNAFHWQWTLALSPSNSLKNVDMDQWWYLQPDGSLLNRTTIRKLGIIAAEVTEHFVPDH